MRQSSLAAVLVCCLTAIALPTWGGVAAAPVPPADTLNAREREAAVNRAAHGRSKAQRQRDAESEGRRNALLDGARRGDSEAP